MVNKERERKKDDESDCLCFEHATEEIKIIRNNLTLVSFLVFRSETFLCLLLLRPARLSTEENLFTNSPLLDDDIAKERITFVRWLSSAFVENWTIHAIFFIYVCLFNSVDSR